MPVPEWTALTAGLTQDEINAKKAAINGHLDHSAASPGTTHSASTTSRATTCPSSSSIRPPARWRPLARRATTACLPAAQVYDPVTNPTGTRCGDPDLAAAVWGSTAGIPAGSLRARQTGDNVGIQYGLEGVARGQDHGRGVRDAEREDRRRRRRFQPSGGAQYRRPAGARHRVPGRIVVERREPRQAADHRLARLGRAGHPLHLAQLRRARPHRCGQRRQSRQPGDVALRHGPAAGAPRRRSRR